MTRFIKTVHEWHSTKINETKKSTVWYEYISQVNEPNHAGKQINSFGHEVGESIFSH